MKVILGLLQPRSGEILREGERITRIAATSFRTAASYCRARPGNS
jgi:ABC-type iron transport system FetAB ATPase subunit